MVTLSSCLIGYMINLSFRRTNMVVYTLEQRWEVSLRSTYRRCRFWQKKYHFFRWNSFWSWRLCKQAKLSHLGHRKPARIHWKPDAPKTSHCLVRILVQKHNWAIFFENKQGEAVTVNGDHFCLQKLKRRILATFGFNRTALSATQPKLHSMFYALFLKITLSAAELMSFGHLGAAIWHLWTIIYGVPSKTSVTPTSQRQLKLQRTIFVKPLVKYSCTQSIICLKIGY